MREVAKHMKTGSLFKANSALLRPPYRFSSKNLPNPARLMSYMEVDDLWQSMY